MNLPAFKYHPEPLETGSIKPSTTVCRCCGRPRGYIYAGSTFAKEDLADSLWPWCIADGSAHRTFACTFTDWYPQHSAGLPRAVIEEVEHRTPGFLGWQQEHWLTCCGDAAAFVGRAGATELERDWPDAIPSIRADSLTSGMRSEDWPDYFKGLELEGGSTAYIFKCLHCGRHIGYSDFD